jgi:pyruvate/2-oxoglutarate dehydrogenase complex dihydrolipoamide dehydrogenase (E3) component
VCSGQRPTTSFYSQKLDAVPSRLLVLGAGQEFAQMMHRFGSKVTVLERGEQILSREDAEVAGALANCLRGEGVEIQLNAAIEQVRKFSDGQVGITFRTPEGKQESTGSHLLVAMGRAPVDCSDYLRNRSTFSKIEPR